MTLINWQEKTVLVSGGGGFLGSYVSQQLQQKKVKRLVVPRSKDYDLTYQENCRKVVEGIDVVIHLAGKIGGIGLNVEKPGEVFYENITMGTHLMEESRKAGVEKFVAMGTVCSYPKYTPLPFNEDRLWDGYPEESNAPYGLAKKMLLVQSQAYRQQYGFNSIVLLSTNFYGPRDHFDERSSHVISAIIKKVHEAVAQGRSEISLWGDGRPTRDLLYVEDAARGIILAAERYDKGEPVNLGTGREISIRDLAQTICRLMGYTGKINWNESKPGGQPRRCVSIARAKEEFGWQPLVSLEEGLKETVEWYEANHISLRV